MKKVKLSTLKDGEFFKRSNKSRTWFKIITRGNFGVVITSKTSEYSALMKPGATVFI